MTRTGRVASMGFALGQEGPHMLCGEELGRLSDSCDAS